AQTSDIGGGIGGGGLTAKKGIRGGHALSALVDVSQLPQTTSLGDALNAAYDQLGKKGMILFFVVGTLSLKRCPQVDLFKAKVKLAHLPRRMTTAAFLHELSRQVCLEDCFLVIRPGLYVELTTLQSALRHNWRGFWLWGSIGFGDPK